MINKHCLEAFNNLEKIPYHPQEYFALGWNAAIDAMSAEFAKKWEEYNKRYSKLQLLCIDCNKKETSCDFENL